MCVTLHPDILDQVVCLCDIQIGLDLEKKGHKKVSIFGYETNMFLKI